MTVIVPPNLDLPPVVSARPGKVNLPVELLTKEQLRQKLNVPHVRIIEEMTRKRKLPVTKLGYRTYRYSWPAVLKALEKLTVKEVGA